MALSPLSHKSQTEYGGQVLRPIEIFICIFLYKLQQKQLCQKEWTAFCCSCQLDLEMLEILTEVERGWLSIVLPVRDAEETLQYKVHSALHFKKAFIANNLGCQ